MTDQVTVRARHLNHPGGRQDIRSILDLGSRAPRFRRQAHAFGAPLGEIDRCTLAIRGSVARRGIGTQPNAMSGTLAFRQSQKNQVHPLVCTPFDRTGSLVALSTEAKKFSWGEKFQA